MSLHGVVEGDIPRIKLESRFASKSLACALKRGSGERVDGLAGHRSRHRVSKVDLPFAFSLTESSVQKPGGVDEEWLLTEAARIEIGRRVNGVVGVRLESHHGPEQGRVDIGCCVRLSKKHVIRQSKELYFVSSSINPCREQLTRSVSDLVLKI